MVVVCLHVHVHACEQPFCGDLGYLIGTVYVAVLLLYRNMDNTYLLARMYLNAYSLLRVFPLIRTIISHIPQVSKSRENWVYMPCPQCFNNTVQFFPLSLFRNAELESLNNEIAQLKLKLAPCKQQMLIHTYILVMTIQYSGLLHSLTMYT